MIGFGGSNGGAKSHAIRDINLLLCLEKKSYTIKTLIFRRRSNDLLENHIIPFFQKYPILRDFFNKTERIIYWPDGSTTKFGSADNETDIEDFEGKEYDYIFIDEATLCTQMMIEFLKTRNRSGNIHPKMIFTMIPGFSGHNYIKRLFVTKEYLDYENPKEYTYLPARVWDNVIWSEKALIEQGFTVDQYYKEWTEEQRKSFCLNYSDYAKTLLHLPEQKRKARLYGDWDIFEGQFFEEWNPEIHIIKEKNYLPFWQLKQMNILGGLDYGNETVLELLAKDYHDNIIIFDELHLSKVLRSEKILKIKEFLKIRGLEKIPIIADLNMWTPDAFDKADQMSPAMEFQKSGVQLIKVSKIDPDNERYRIACNDAFKDALHYEIDESTGLLIKHPKLKVYARCRSFINTFPSLIINEINPEDIDKNQNDHDYDAAKYAYMTLRAPKEPMKDEAPKWLKKIQKQHKERKQSIMSA
ncbi:MAG: terminase family protein [Candidatus Omnitrophica bacterium]|jgi:phage terminase large subunit|nr:terminase family protein [Candidatus Omnitrophota bacterium]